MREQEQLRAAPVKTTARVYSIQPRALYEASKQQVTVTENSVTEVTVVLKAKQ